MRSSAPGNVPAQNNSFDEIEFQQRGQVLNKIHFFKFDQRIVTFYHVDTKTRSRELLHVDFNIPIRFCSIQTNDGRIFLTGGAKNSS